MQRISWSFSSRSCPIRDRVRATRHPGAKGPAQGLTAQCQAVLPPAPVRTLFPSQPYPQSQHPGSRCQRGCRRSGTLPAPEALFRSATRNSPAPSVCASAHPLDSLLVDLRLASQPVRYEGHRHPGKPGRNRASGPGNPQAARAEPTCSSTPTTAAAAGPPGRSGLAFDVDWVLPLRRREQAERRL